MSADTIAPTIEKKATTKKATAGTKEAQARATRAGENLPVKAKDGVKKPTLTVKLAQHERIIEDAQAMVGRQASIIGEHLEAIHKDWPTYGLETPYETFDEYLEKRWDFSRKRFQQLVKHSKAVAVIKALPDITVKPIKEGQTRAITDKLKEPDWAEAWEKAIEISDGKDPSIINVNQAVDELLQARQAAMEFEKEEAEKKEGASEKITDKVKPPIKPDTNGAVVSEEKEDGAATFQSVEGYKAPAEKKRNWYYTTDVEWHNESPDPNKWYLQFKVVRPDNPALGLKGTTMKDVRISADTLSNLGFSLPHKIIESEGVFDAPAAEGEADAPVQFDVPPESEEAEAVTA